VSSVGRRRASDVLLDVLARGYDLEAPDDVWLRGITDAVRPLLDEGLGTFGWKLDIETRLVATMSLSGAAPELEHAIRGIHADASAEEFAVGYSAPFSTLSARFGERWHELEIADRYLRGYGIEDSSGFVTVDPGAKFLLLVGAPLPHVRKPTKLEERRWAAVAVHLGAACRLRERLANRAAGAEAILTPEGSVEDAHGPAKLRSARDLLRESVLLREKALGRRAIAEPDRALEMWQGLVEGRWTLVDRFERDGRRYVVAHPNEFTALGPPTLTDRERTVLTMAGAGHPLKLIAYELGLAAPTVSLLLQSGMKRIGIRSRAELVRVYTALRLASAGVPARASSAQQSAQGASTVESS
jgi:DNA-binding CsgD family transcriptional regulator